MFQGQHITIGHMSSFFPGDERKHGGIYVAWQIALLTLCLAFFSSFEAARFGDQHPGEVCGYPDDALPGGGRRPHFLTNIGPFESTGSQETLLFLTYVGSRLLAFPTVGFPFFSTTGGNPSISGSLSPGQLG